MSQQASSRTHQKSYGGRVELIRHGMTLTILGLLQLLAIQTKEELISQLVLMPGRTLSLKPMIALSTLADLAGQGQPVSVITTIHASLVGLALQDYFVVP